MRALWSLRREAAPRIVVAVYAAITALNIACTALLPGSPFFSENYATVGSAILIESMIVGFMLRRSLIAWWAAIFFTTFGAVVTPVVLLDQWGASGAAKPAIVSLLYGLSLVVVLSPSLERWFRGDGSAQQTLAAQ